MSSVAYQELVSSESYLISGKKLTEHNLAWNTEALHTPTKPYTLLDFEDEKTVSECKTFADRAVGGFSTASLDYEPAEPSSNTPAHVRFHGSISTKLPDNWRVERTGKKHHDVTFVPEV